MHLVSANYDYLLQLQALFVTRFDRLTNMNDNVYKLRGFLVHLKMQIDGSGLLMLTNH